MIGIQSHCFLKGHKWGECTCNTEVSLEDGFEFEGHTIVDPTISECGCFFVDPIVYYGKAFTTWNKNMTAKELL